MGKNIVTTHGAAKSNYDRKVRGIASQYRDTECSSFTLRDNIAADIAKIKRANTAVAANCYTVKVVDEFLTTERVEIWNEVIPGKERLKVTIMKEVSNG